MTIGELNRRIEVLQLIEERDTFGQVVGNWATVGRVWAKIEQLKGNESFNSQQIKSSQPVKITVRFYAGLTVKHRIKYLDTVYEITGIADEKTLHRWTVIEAKEWDNGNI